MESSENIPAANPTERKGKLIPALVVLVVLAAALLAFFGNEYFTLSANPDAENQKKIEAVVVKVEKLIDLPQGEVPTLATVSDTSNLKGQAFFEHAEVGDQVLLYTNAKKAYLYSPSKNIIIEVASLNIGE